MDISVWIGSMCFGIVIGWITYYTMRKNTKPRELAGFSGPGSGYLGKVAAKADSLAVGGVSGEPVSEGNSLICRENTAIFYGIGPSWRRTSQHF